MGHPSLCQESDDDEFETLPRFGFAVHGQIETERPIGFCQTRIISSTDEGNVISFRSRLQFGPSRCCVKISLSRFSAEEKKLLKYNSQISSLQIFLLELLRDDHSQAKD